jgi:hypothetical protein
MARPSTYDIRAGLLIAHGLSLGLSYRQIADIAASMSWQPQIARWKANNPDFAELCDLAIRARTEPLARDELWCQILRFMPEADRIREQVQAFARTPEGRKWLRTPLPSERKRARSKGCARKRKR